MSKALLKSVIRQSVVRRDIVVVLSRLRYFMSKANQGSSSTASGFESILIHLIYLMWKNMMTLKTRIVMQLGQPIITSFFRPERKFGRFVVKHVIYIVPDVVSLTTW